MTTSTRSTAYTVEQGVICSASGIPEAPRWFSDSRLSFQLDEAGVTRVGYCSPAQKAGNQTLFLQRLWDGFRVYMQRELRNYRPTYRNTRIWPFGIEAEWELFGVVFRLRIMAVEERIVFQLITPDNIPVNVKWKLEFYEHFALVPNDAHDPRFGSRGAVRTWEAWAFDELDNALTGGFRETPAATAEAHRETSGAREMDDAAGAAVSRQHVGIRADFPLSFSRTAVNTKYTLTSAEPLRPNGEYAFVVTFAQSREEAVRPWEPAPAIERQFDRYRRVADAMPVLDSPYPALNDYFALLPMYHESCKVIDTPGAIKAKNMEYWVWGWDGLTSNHATMYWGDAGFVADMLRFYEETADPRLGIAHAYRHDMRPISASALPAQGMYISLLLQYYAMTGDLEQVRRRYPFARTVFGRIAALEAGGTGLCEGTSLFPDFPGFMRETGRDLSGMNNTMFYAAARAMEQLASLLGDAETAAGAEAIFRRFEEHFIPLFFDEARGFPVSSVDAVTLQRRDSFNANAVKWDNNYCRELLADVHERCLSFLEEHAVTPSGLREIPLWSGAFDADANQLHCWWPVTGEYYMRLINAMNRSDRIAQWIGWVGYWSRHLTCPEGIPLYTESAEPELDRWNSLRGAWQAYSMRGWYQAAVHGVVGVDAEVGGLHVYPYDGEPLTLRNLHYRGKKLTIEMTGSGRFVASIEIAGRTVIGTNKVPDDLIAEAEGEAVAIRVNRTGVNSHPLHIVHGYGFRLTDFSYGADGISAQAEGAGTVRLKIGSPRRPAVHIDGKPVDVSYDENNQTALVEMKCIPGIKKAIRIGTTLSTS